MHHLYIYWGHGIYFVIVTPLLHYDKWIPSTACMVFVPRGLQRVNDGNVDNWASNF